jgi:hypothetical protein
MSEENPRPRPDDREHEKRSNDEPWRVPTEIPQEKPRDPQKQR